MGSITGPRVEDIIYQRYIKGLKTYIITLKFSDLSLIHRDVIEHISYGGDLWEFRADLLQDTSLLDRTPIPSINYVRSQLQSLQQKTNLPILFTLRSVSQGGRFPDEASKEALSLMKLAAELGCQYIDVEIQAPPFVIEGIRAVKRDSKIVASYHEFSGNVRWTSRTLKEKCDAANRFGDIIRLCIQAVDINDSFEHGLFIRDYQTRIGKPIIAVAMGSNGQLSRFTAPVTFVTHRLIPQSPGSDHMILSDINRALYSLGQLPRRTFCINGPDSFFLSSLLGPSFEELGLPYRMCHRSEGLERAIAGPDFGGACVGSDFIHAGKYVRRKSDSAEKIGVVNTIHVTKVAGDRRLNGHNTTWRAIQACIGKSNLDVTKTVALIIGHGFNSRAACYAVQRLGFEKIIIASADEEKAHDIALDFEIRWLSLRPKHIAKLPVIEDGIVIIKCNEEAVSDEDIINHVCPVSASVFIDLEHKSHSGEFEQLVQNNNRWKVHTAEDVLREQAFALFEIWAGRRAPKLVMEAAMKAGLSH